MKLRSPFETEKISEEWLIERMRLERNKLLAASDWTVLPDSSMDKVLWTQYRQNLRNFPNTWTPSEEANFPDFPE